jgi:uncharacterized linocin/CFP29 family protein
LAAGEEDIMADAQLGWSDAQWQMVNNVIDEEFERASVAGACLSRYGPLAAGAETVRNEQLNTAAVAVVSVTDDTTLQLFNLTVQVPLSSEQVAHEALSSALLAFRRAANILALVEDDIVFNGYVAAAPAAGPGRAVAPAVRPSGTGTPARTAAVVKSGPTSLSGLIPPTGSAQINASPGVTGAAVVGLVATAIAGLEARSHTGPFACILGTDVFVEVHTPDHGLALPADRITPLLNGPLLRSGQMPDKHGIVVPFRPTGEPSCRAGNALDIVVATPPKAQLLQVDGNAKYIFRVYERFVLRVKDSTSVQAFSI